MPRCMDTEMLVYQDAKVLWIQRHLDAGIPGCRDAVIERNGDPGFRDARISGYVGAGVLEFCGCWDVELSRCWNFGMPG